LFINRDLCSITISQKFSLYDYQGQIKPLLPSKAKLGPLLEQAGDLICAADRLLGDGTVLVPGALRTQEVSVGVHAAPVAAQLLQF
jgi:hypothetical protein